MPGQTRQRILTINTGSSSLKLAIYEAGGEEKRILSGLVERIGAAQSRLRLTDPSGATLVDQESALADHGAALEAVLDWLKQNRPELRIDALGHRVVHGGSSLVAPHRITTDLVATLRELVSIAPDHLPQAIQAIEVAGRAFSDLPQVACFDTAFHSRMPRHAKMYPLPRRFGDLGVIRFGFHGLSYEYIMHELEAVAPRESQGRLIIAHLGNGASMAAVRDGVGIETTMGFTPAGGLMMGTRTGDLDPGVLLYLLNEPKMNPAALDEIINKQSGLLGVSGISADMRDLLSRESADEHAAEAIALYCYQAKKFLGALAAAQGGLETLVFTGGIGEHAAPIRMRVCEGLEFLGIQLDPDRNNAHAPIISRAGSRVTVRVMQTDEDLMIARHTRSLVGQTG